MLKYWYLWGFFISYIVSYIAVWLRFRDEFLLIIMIALIATFTTTIIKGIMLLRKALKYIKNFFE